MSGQNVVDGFSCILDIQIFSGGGHPDPLEKTDTWSEPSFYKTFLLTTTTSQLGGQALNFRELGSTVEKCILFGVGQAPQTPEIRQSLKISSLVQREIEEKMKEGAGTKIHFWWRSSYHEL